MSTSLSSYSAHVGLTLVRSHLLSITQSSNKLKLRWFFGRKEPSDVPEALKCKEEKSKREQKTLIRKKRTKKVSFWFGAKGRDLHVLLPATLGTGGLNPEPLH